MNECGVGAACVGGETCGVVTAMLDATGVVATTVDGGSPGVTVFKRVDELVDGLAADKGNAVGVAKEAALSDNRDERTLSTELVAVNVPSVMLGTVPASVIVGVVERPTALLRAVSTSLVLIAGVTEDIGGVGGVYAFATD